MEQLLKQIESSLDKGLRNLVLFDYDGTLTPIVDDPQDAWLSAEAKDLLQELSSKDKTEVAIVTGRSYKDIKNFVDLPTLSYITNHGYMVEIDGKVTTFGADYFNKEKHFGVKYEKLLMQLKAFPELTVETKEFSTSFHYRNVKEADHERCRKTILQLLSLFFGAKEISIKEGKKVIDILPPDPMDKGIAIKYLLERFRDKYPNDDFSVIFVGDDVTDEDGFRYVNEISQISVKVGDQDTIAKYRIDDVTQVHKLIALIAKMIDGVSQAQLF